MHRTAAALPLSGALSALLEAAEPYGRPTRSVGLLVSPRCFATIGAMRAA